MRSPSRNEGKGCRFGGTRGQRALVPLAPRALAVALAIGWGCAPPALAAQASDAALPAQSVELRGLVEDADGAPAPGCAVAFHCLASQGVAWLRSAGERILTVHGASDAHGRFVLRVPAGVTGSCTAARGAECALISVHGASAPVRLRLGRPRTRRFTVTGLPEAAALDVLFEGPSPAPAVRAAVSGGHVEVPRVDGLGSVVLLPEGSVTRNGRLPWFGASGADRDRIAVLRATTWPLAFAWAAPAGEARLVRFDGAALTGPSEEVWCGQSADGSPFALRGAEVARAAGTFASSVQATGLHEAVGAAHARLCLGDDEVVFVATGRLAPAGTNVWRLPAWMDGAGALLLGRDDAGWRVLAHPGGDAPASAHTLRARVRDETGRPLAATTVRVRPLRCRPREPWQAMPGLEVVVGSDGRAALPVRLPDGTYEWIAMAPDGRSAFGEVAVASGTTELEVELSGAASVQGFVIDADGEPIAGLAVTLQSGGSQQPASFGWPEHRTFTGPGGEFVLRGLAPERLYELSCGSPAWGEGLVDGVRAGATGLALQLRPPAAPR